MSEPSTRVTTLPSGTRRPGILCDLADVHARIHRVLRCSVKLTGMSTDLVAREIRYDAGKKIGQCGQTILLRELKFSRPQFVP